MKYLTNKHVLIISPEPWSTSFVSKHHYASTLAAVGNKVYFLGPPNSSPSVDAPTPKGLKIFKYDGFPKGFRYYPSSFRRAYLRRWMREFERREGITIDVIWNFDSSVFFDLGAWKNQKLTIAHLVDLNQAYEWERMTSQADLGFCTTQFILNRMRKFNSQTYLIQHGFSPATYSHMPNLPGQGFPIKVGYVGNLDIPYLDWKLINELVNRNSSHAFYFIGPLKDKKLPNGLNSLKNAFWLGAHPAKKLPGFLRQFDILLICYDAQHHYEQLANPHKIMEYLSSGKVVVATPTAYYQAYAPSLIQMPQNHDHERFLTCYNEVARNLEFFNSSMEQQKRISYAEDNTYEKQLSRIDGHIVSLNRVLKMDN